MGIVQHDSRGTNCRVTPSIRGAGGTDFADCGLTDSWRPVRTLWQRHQQWRSLRASPNAEPRADFAYYLDFGKDLAFWSRGAAVPYQNASKYLGDGFCRIVHGDGTSLVRDFTFVPGREYIASCRDDDESSWGDTDQDA